MRQADTPGAPGGEEISEHEALAQLRAVGAYREGHFVLSSGRHSAVYIQCALAMAAPQAAETLCAGLAAKIRRSAAALAPEDRPQLCVSPAMGGVIVGYEVGRQLGLRAIFAERPDGVFEFRRGFEIPKGTPCLMVEDVVTTGKSSRECIAALEQAGGRCVLAASLIDRTGGDVDLGVALTSLVRVDAPTYARDMVPPELAAIEPQKPGSRRLADDPGKA